ncbi:MAG TPA: hypothetical protein DEF88_12500, partial [Porphyromonadaceae bacterium]|nr:hypothetical protein [Porphyromonadaceae bacterium]
MKGLLFAVVWIISLGMVAQTSIQGTVTDAGGTPMIGVNVIEKGTTNGIMTDVDGKFALRVASPASTVVFSYVGFMTQEIVVGDKRQFSIVMDEDTESLQEIVVV